MARPIGTKKRPQGRRGSSYSWEVWSKGDARYGEDALFIGAYKDKGQAQDRIRRLQRSNGYAYDYFLKRTTGAPRQTIGGHRSRRAQASFWNRMDDGRSKTRRRRRR